MSLGKYNNLGGKHVLVIGGSSGIGFCVAEACVEAGSQVTIISSKASRVDGAVERLQNTARPRGNSDSENEAAITGFTCDLSAPEKLESNVMDLFDRLPVSKRRVDHIVFTAVDPLTPCALEDISLDTMRDAGLLRFFAPLMVAKHGVRRMDTSSTACSILLTAGVVAEKPIPELGPMPSAYASALEGAVRSLALLLKPVRVNLVSPGPVATELWDPFPREYKRATWQAMAAKHATGSIGRPESVAQAYLYCMRDENCTGTIVRSDSGTLLM